MRTPHISTPILLGSSNPGKLSEVAAFGELRGLSIIGLKDPSLQACGAPPHVPEVAQSYEGNARLKGVAYARWAGMPCVTDDTGIEVSVLGGLPGVFTAPWGPERVKESLQGQRSVCARFVCCMVYTEPNGRSVSVVCGVDGELRAPKISGQKQSLPFSGFFYPAGADKSLKDLLAEGMFQYSHRYRAFDTLLRVLS